MATWSFKDKNTNEVFDMWFQGWAARDEYLKENPHIEVDYSQSAPAIISGAMGTGSNKVPDGFKEVLSKVAEAHPGTEFADRHGKLGIKEAKTRQVVKKHVEKITKRIESGS